MHRGIIRLILEADDTASSLWKREYIVIVLGVILLILGLLLGVSILYTIGLILIVVGAVLWILGSMGRGVGGRAHYW
jgi:hypothetical protein